MGSSYGLPSLREEDLPAPLGGHRKRRTQLQARTTVDWGIEPAAQQQAKNMAHQTSKIAPK
jgi:hypothetical protein